MTIGGLVKFSLNDYPGKASAVIFTRGCDFRCHYCHNPELVIPERYAPEISLSEIYSFLESRKGQLDAVTVTGGEPSRQSDLLEFLDKVKRMGFLTKLDTNGTAPETIEKIIKNRAVDYIAMDIKAPFGLYEKIIKVRSNSDHIKASVEIIMKSGVSHEFRTTVVKSLTSFDDLREIARSIKGAQKYFLQRFIPAKKLNDPKFAHELSYSEDELKTLALELSGLVGHCAVR